MKILFAAQHVSSAVQGTWRGFFSKRGDRCTFLFSGDAVWMALEFEMTQGQPYDVVVVDTHLTYCDAPTLIAKIKGDERFRILPVMVLVPSPYCLEGVRVIGLDGLANLRPNDLQGVAKTLDDIQRTTTPTV